VVHDNQALPAVMRVRWNGTFENHMTRVNGWLQRGYSIADDSGDVWVLRRAEARRPGAYSCRSVTTEDPGRVQGAVRHLQFGVN